MWHIYSYIKCIVIPHSLAAYNRKAPDTQAVGLEFKPVQTITCVLK